MAQLSSWSLLLLLIIPLLHSSSAIKCYVCNSKQEPKCQDPFKGPGSGLSMVDCTQDHQQRQNTRKAIEDVLTLMTKLGQIPPVVNGSDQPMLPPANETIPMACQKLEMIVVGEKVWGRGCSSKALGYYRPCDAIKVVTNSEITLQHCSLCDEDGCNGGHNTRRTPWVILITLPLLLLK